MRKTLHNSVLGAQWFIYCLQFQDLDHQVDNSVVSMKLPLAVTAISESRIKHERRFDLPQRKTTLQERTSAGQILNQVAFAGGNRPREVLRLCGSPQLGKHSEQAD